MSADGFHGERTSHAWIPPSHDIEDDCQIRYLDESGPFLPSFLLNSDDEVSPLDNSSLVVNESEQTTLNLTCSDSSGGDDSYDMPQLKRSDSKGYEADEDGDFLKRDAVTVNTVQVDVTNVTSALGDAACDDNDQRVNKTVGNDINEKDNDNKKENMDNTYDLIKMVANENAEEVDSDYFEKKLCLIKEEIDEIKGRNDMSAEQKYVFLNNCFVEFNKILGPNEINEKIVFMEEYLAEELENLADVKRDCLADSFCSQKEQEVVHSVRYEADSSESPVDHDDQTVDYSENPANEAFIAENTVEERDNNFNDYLNYMAGGIIFYFVLMFVSLIIYQIQTVDTDNYPDIDFVDAMVDGNEMENLN